MADRVLPSRRAIAADLMDVEANSTDREKAVLAAYAEDRLVDREELIEVGFPRDGFDHGDGTVTRLFYMRMPAE